MLFRDFLDYARLFHQAAIDNVGLPHTAMRHSSASILFAWIAVEALINDMMADFASLPEDTFSIHERAFLTEQAVEFMRKGNKLGLFVVTERSEYKRLEDKIMFLLARFGGGTVLDKGSSLWQKFERAKNRRNSIAHPRKDAALDVTPDDASDAIEVAEAIIQVVAMGVWGKKVDV